MIVNSFIRKHRILVSNRDDWRAFPFETQCAHTLRGQDHLGECIPRITDGTHAWVELQDGSVFEVHILNLQKLKFYSSGAPRTYVTDSESVLSPDQKLQVRIDEKVSQYIF